MGHVSTQKVKPSRFIVPRIIFLHVSLSTPMLYTQLVLSRFSKYNLNLKQRKSKPKKKKKKKKEIFESSSSSMVKTVTVSTRRALSFPAIQPCDSVSPYTLVDSLIELAENICGFKSRLFASNNWNAREAIRQVGIILGFLEEVRGSASELPDGVVLSFSELHLSFQKVRWLLEDCSGDGARVWMLAKSERVAYHFRVFSRAIATALEVLPVEEIDAPPELKDHVGLVMRQARKSRFDVDREDKRVLGIVNSVLSGFENGVIPDKGDLRLVLDYLGIRSWSKCNKEAKFLDSVMEFESFSEDKTEMSLLSSLMGFVCYCRCALFDAVDGEAGRQSSGKCSSEALIGIKDDDFRCPISLEIMADPVTIASGHTYDRVSIAKWFAAGNLICPKTGERLKSVEMVPNLALRRLIQLYCSENYIPLVESRPRNRHAKRREVFAASLAAGKALRATANLLADVLMTGTVKEKNKAAYEVRLLSKASVFNRSCLVEGGVVPPLLKLLTSADSLSQENAAASLLNLSKLSETRAVVFQNGGSEVLVNVLKQGLNSETRQHVAGVVFYLASVEEYRISIGENPDTFPALVALIKDGTGRGKKNAMVAIFGLLAHIGNHSRVLAEGTVPLLADFLVSSDHSEELVTDSLAILSILGEKPDGAAAILYHGALDSAVEFLNSSISVTAKEQCVSLLLALCKNGEKDVVAQLAKNASLIGSLYSLLSEGSSRASKKGSALIRVLHEFHERSTSGLMAPVLRQERFVHAW